MATSARPTAYNAHPSLRLVHYTPKSHSATVSISALHLIAVLLSINTLSCVAAYMAGLAFPYNYFLFNPIYNFSDYFGLIASYADGKGNGFDLDHSTLRMLIPSTTPPSQTLHGPGGEVMSHFHMTPMATVCAQIVLRLSQLIDPIALFFIFAGSILGAWCRIAWRFGQDRYERIIWMVIGVIAYPTLMMFVRGNLFAGLVMLLITQAMLLACRRQGAITAAILLAIAINIRPNAILFAVPLLLLHWQYRYKMVAILAASGVTIFAASLLSATLLYPAYRLESFLAGLHTYYFIYVVNNFGVPYGSSLFGAIKLLIGFHERLDTASTLIALAILGLAAIAYQARRIGDAELLFLTASAYCLGSSVIGDYHLGVFIIVPMALALDDRVASNDRVAMTRRLMLVVSCLILAPKNYFVNEVSLQIVLNPAMLLAASLIMLTNMMILYDTADRSPALL